MLRGSGFGGSVRFGKGVVQVGASGFQAGMVVSNSECYLGRLSHLVKVDSLDSLDLDSPDLDSSEVVGAGSLLHSPCSRDHIAAGVLPNIIIIARPLQLDLSIFSAMSVGNSSTGLIST